MTTEYTVYDKATGNIITSGYCQDTEAENQVVDKDAHAVVLIQSDIIEDRIIHGNYKDRKKVKRSEKEIKARRDKMKPKEIPLGEQQASITNDQLSELLARIEALENKE